MGQKLSFCCSFKTLCCLALVLALIFVPVSNALAVVPKIKNGIALLRALDKVTARVAELEIPIGVPFQFGTVTITARTCLTTLPEQMPESAAYLDVTENKGSEGQKNIFRGWMFASSPALSALEHPVYDIWVVGCKQTDAAK